MTILESSAEHGKAPEISAKYYKTTLLLTRDDYMGYALLLQGNRLHDRVLELERNKEELTQCLGDLKERSKIVYEERLNGVRIPY